LAYYQVGDYEGAIADFDLVLRLNPNDAHTYHHRGLVFHKLGELEQAIEDFNRALQIDPSLPGVLHIRDVALGTLEERKPGRFLSQENRDFVEAVSPYPPPPTDDFMGISGVVATTGGLPVQENKTAPALRGDKPQLKLMSGLGDARFICGFVLYCSFAVGVHAHDKTGESFAATLWRCVCWTVLSWFIQWSIRRISKGISLLVKWLEDNYKK